MELDTKSISILNKPPKTVIFRRLLTINHEIQKPLFCPKTLARQALEPQVFRPESLPIELLSHISSLPRNAKLLFVCQEQTSSEAMKQIIEYNVHHVESKAVMLQCVENNISGLQEFDLVVCSSQVENQLSRYILSSLKLMTFSIGIDPVNLLVLQARLAAVEMEKLV